MNIAVITGTTRGLGKALAKRFESAGWHVVELSRPQFDFAELDHRLVATEFDRIALASAFLRHFPSGEIAHISSSVVDNPLPYWSLYIAAKAGVDSYLRALEVEGIKCFRLNPGAVDTDMQQQIRASDFSGVEAFVEMKNSGKLKAPDAVAKALFWMIDRRVFSLPTRSQT
jgi:NAD(P)-dependent dehydrogenase (short-subunit alcohol dehydrogenase family)